jgi:hypothetical protein
MKNDLTFNKLRSMALQQTETTENDVPPGIMQSYINMCLQKIYQILDGLNDPFYNMASTLTIGDDIEFLKDSAQAGTVTALAVNQDGDIEITRSAGTFAAGAILDISLVNKDTGEMVRHCIGRVATGGATGTVGIISGTMIDYAAATYRLTVGVIKTFSDDAADISTVYVKDIVKIFDDAGANSVERVFDQITDARVFGMLHKDPFKAARVAWYQRGDVIQFFVGASATALGVVQMEYRGKPNFYSDATENNEILLPPAYNVMLFDEVALMILRHVKKAPPADMLQRAEQYRAIYEASAGDKVRGEEKRGK